MVFTLKVVQDILMAAGYCWVKITLFQTYSKTYPFSGQYFKQFASIVRLEIHTVNYEPLRGSSFIPLPEGQCLKKAIINFKNEDNECFKCAVTTALNPVNKMLNK